MLTTTVYAMEHDEGRLDKGFIIAPQVEVSHSSPHIQALEDQLTLEVGNVFEELSLRRNLGQVSHSLHPEADFQCDGALKASRSGNPTEFFSKLKTKIEKIEGISKVSISDKGHINISVKDEILASYASYMLNDNKLGIYPRKASQKVIIDFGGPNIAKPMHVGHLRSSIVGESLKRIFRYMGDVVIGDIHLGDWGLHIGMVINGLKKRFPGIPYFKDNYNTSIPVGPVVTIKDLEEIYPIEATLCKSNKEERQKARDITAQLQEGHVGYTALWQHIADVSVADLKKNYKTLGIDFDLWLGESSVNNRIPEIVRRAKEKGISIIKEGATVIPIKEDGDKIDMPDVVLLKSNGGVTYQTTDLATIEDRMEKLDPNLILYVVDQRQGLHFKQVFRAARKLGLVSEETQLEHAGFGTINGTDGKPFKTRAGDVMKLEDLIKMSREKSLKIIKDRLISIKKKQVNEEEQISNFDERESYEIADLVGQSAIKYSDLSHNRLDDYTFDLDKITTFHGDTGPYLLYTTVRIKSILQNADKFRSKLDGKEVTFPLTTEERKLILTLSRLPKALDLAYTERSPARVAQHSMDTAKSFNLFYKACPIINKRQGKLFSSRFSLAILTLKSLNLTLDLLGIKSPKRM